jgi:HEAT repeat protein
VLTMPERDANGRFVKGISGNPGGRPKAVGFVTELAQKHTESAVATLVTIMKDPKSNAQARASAANALLDRGYGKPQQLIDQTTRDETRKFEKPDTEAMVRRARERRGYSVATDTNDQVKQPAATVRNASEAIARSSASDV